jgi:predicted  nucleic acid-binding Zn-ribbon protein
MDPVLSAVLQLQECEGRRMATEKELRGVPLDLESVRKARASLESGIEAERHALRELELRAKQTEHQIHALEERSAKLKGQQMQVKKNEEYQALGREIEGVAADQSKLEEAELGLLYELDTRRAALKEAEARHVAGVQDLDARQARIVEREKGLRARLEGEVASIAAARTAVAAPLLGSFDRLLKQNKFPAVVALHGTSCTGCHMRVSNGIEQETRKGSGKLATCDNCGRLVFLQA